MTANNGGGGMPAPPPAYCFHQVFEPMGPVERTFDRDYLLYAIEGAVRLGVADRYWLLPPAFAAWVPARTSIGIEMTHPVTSCSVLFERGFVAGTGASVPDEAVVFTMSPLAREMVLHARRWPMETDRAEWSGSAAATFFAALAHVVAELAAKPSPVWRPIVRDEALRRALAFTEANMGRAVTVAEVAAAAHLSERTLLRRLASETGGTWAGALKRMRMIRAVERVTTSDDPIAVIANEVGYSALSAFNEAFREFAGTTPSAMQRDPVR